MGRLTATTFAAVVACACVPPRPAPPGPLGPTATRDALTSAPPRQAVADADVVRDLPVVPDAGSRGPATDAGRPRDASHPPVALAEAGPPPDATPEVGTIPDVWPASEQVCDGADDDADGRIDEGIGCYIDIYRARWTNRHDNGDFYYAREPGFPPYWNCDSGGCGLQGPTFTVYAEPGVPGTIPLHLLFDTLEVDHLVTSDPAEVEGRVAQGAWYLGTLGHVYPADHVGRTDAVPLVRLHNRDVHTWLFTVIPREQLPQAFVSTDVPSVCCLAFPTAPPAP